MRSCPTLNNNITTNNYKTMMEEAPNATDHDDDSKRRASSYSYDLPNQEPKQDGDGSLVPPDILTIADIFNYDDDKPLAALLKKRTATFKKWRDERTAEESKLREMVRAHKKSSEERKMRMEERKMRRKADIQRTTMMSMPLEQKQSSKLSLASYNVLSDRTLKAMESPLSSLERVTKSSEPVTNSGTNFDRDNPSLSDVLSPSLELELLLSNDQDRERRRRAECEKLYQWKAESQHTTTLINKTIELTSSTTATATGKLLLQLNLPNESKKEQEQLPPSKQLYRAINADANFDRDNPSSSNIISSPSPELELLLSYDHHNNGLIKPPSTELPSSSSKDNKLKRSLQTVSYNVLSNRTDTNFKPPPSERVINPDANFDRDNPLLSTMVKSLPPSSSERVINVDTNFDRDNPASSALLLSSSNDTVLSPSSELKLISDNILSNRTANNSRPTPSMKRPLVSYNVLSSLQSIQPPSMEFPLSLSNDTTEQSIKSPLSNNNNNDSHNLNHNNNNNNNNNASNALNASISPNSLPSSSEPPSSQLQSIQPTLLTSIELSFNQSPSLNHIDNISTNALNKNINNNVRITTTVPVTTSRTPVTVKITRKVNEMKIPGMIHTTNYAATENHATSTSTKTPSTRSKFSIAHEEASTAIPKISSTRSRTSIAHEETCSKYAATENHVTEKWKFSSPRSKISIAHEEASTAIPKFSSTKSRTSIAHEETNSKYAATENLVTKTPPTGSKISIAHEEASTAIPKFSSTRQHISIAHEEAIPKVLKSSKSSSTRSRTSMAHEEASTATMKTLEAHGSKYTRMNTKYATTATEQSSYVPTPISNEDHIDNDKSFRSQYLQTVQKITNITHEEASMEKSKVSKPQSKNLILGLKGCTITPTLYEPHDTKYDISTEQISTLMVNNSSFCSQYLQIVQKITNNNNNNNIGILNNIMLLLSHPIIPIHPFIEYLQPEPEPPPLNSYLLLFLFLFIGKTKQKVVLFILKSLTLIKHNNNSDTLSYINNIKTVLTHHHVWSSSSFSAPLTDSKFLQIHINHTLLTHTKTNILLFIPEFRFCKCGEV